MRLIDADDMKTDVIYQTAYMSLLGGKVADFAEIIKKGILEEIEKAPTIDAVPVVHGEWIKNDNDTWSCSLCHAWIPNEQHYYARYCLFCGAKMEVQG